MTGGGMGLVRKALWLLRRRPGEFLRTLRGYALFRITRLFWRNSAEVVLGNNVRLQRLRSVRAERPDARIQIGDHSIIYESANLGAYGKGRIEIGECSVLGAIRIASRHGVRIGRRFICSWNVFIQDFDPHPLNPEERARQLEAICAGFRPSFAPVPYPEKNTWPFPGEEMTSAEPLCNNARLVMLVKPTPFLRCEVLNPIPLSVTAKMSMLASTAKLIWTFFACACFRILFICSCTIL